MVGEPSVPQEPPTPTKKVSEVTPKIPPPPVYETVRDEMKAIEKQIKEKLLKDELAELKGQGTPIFEEITALKANKPMFRGRGKWQKDMNELLSQYNPIKEKYDEKKKQGLTVEHTDKAISIIKSDYPELWDRYTQEVTAPPVKTKVPTQNHETVEPKEPETIEKSPEFFQVVRALDKATVYLSDVERGTVLKAFDDRFNSGIEQDLEMMGRQALQALPIATAKLAQDNFNKVLAGQPVNPPPTLAPTTQSKASEEVRISKSNSNIDR